MTPPVATGAMLWCRAAVLSVVALGAGAFAHVQADGLLPGPGVLVFLVLGGTLAGAPMLRRPGSTRRIVVLDGGRPVRRTHGARGDGGTPR